MAGDGGGDVVSIHQRIHECCRRMQRPCLCRGVGTRRKGNYYYGNSLARARRYDNFTAGPFICLCVYRSLGYQGTRGTDKQGHQQWRVRVIRCKSLQPELDSRLDSVASPIWPSTRCTVPLHVHYPHGFSHVESSFLLSVQLEYLAIVNKNSTAV